MVSTLSIAEENVNRFKNHVKLLLSERNLHEIIIRMRKIVTPRLSRDLKRRLACLRDRRWPTEAIGPVIGSSTSIDVNTHETITLVAVFRGVFGRINRDQVVIGTPSVKGS
jgi:hypothetical protein